MPIAMKALAPFALLAVSSLAAAQSPTTVAKKAAADYQKATMKKDFASFEKSSTPDFVYIDGKGQKAGKAQALAGMKGFFGAMTMKSVRVKALSAKKAEGGIVYVQEEWLEGSMKMGVPKPSKFTAHTKDEVLMVNAGGKWMTKRVKSLMTDDRIDGKKMPGM